MGSVDTIVSKLRKTDLAKSYFSKFIEHCDSSTILSIELRSEFHFSLVVKFGAYEVFCTRDITRLDDLDTDRKNAQFFRISDVARPFIQRLMEIYWGKGKTVPTYGCRIDTVSEALELEFHKLLRYDPKAQERFIALDFRMEKASCDFYHSEETQNKVHGLRIQRESKQILGSLEHYLRDGGGPKHHPFLPDSYDLAFDLFKTRLLVNS